MRLRRASRALLLMAAVAWLAGCGGDDGGGTSEPTATSAPATATRTPTLAGTIPATSTATSALPPPTATPTTATSGAVSGLVVVRGDLRASAGDALGAPPAEWNGGATAEAFDRALSHASWRVPGEGLSGSTGADGRFSITGLAPGPQEVELSRTLNGNLVSARIPFVVGDDGGASLVVELAPGQVRWTAVHLENGREIRETGSPNGSRVSSEGDRLLALSSAEREYRDPDGDGSFDPDPCYGTTHVWLCEEGATCGDDRTCACAASCPLCEDCPFGVCVPPMARQPYACVQGTCADPNDRCACVSSCPDCDDCAASVCVPRTCTPATVQGLEIHGPAGLIVGQAGSMTALARMSDGWVIDVTHLVEWSSTDTSVASVDAWGSIAAQAAGSTTIGAALGGIESEPWTLTVRVRPALQRIHLQNVSCAYPIGAPVAGPEAALPRPGADHAILPPHCRQVVRIGGTLSFFALGEFDEGYYEDVTARVSWEVSPASVGQVSNGTFTGAQVGTATISAQLDGVTSNATEIRVVDQPTIVALQIFPLTALPRPGPLPPVDHSDAAIPCYDCGYTVTILEGDQLPFQAVAAYDTGEWENVTERVTWSSSDAAAAPITDAGVLSGNAAGETAVSASLGEVASNSVAVRVVESATLLGLSIYQEGLDRVVQKGDEAFFRALGYYDIGFDRDVTPDVAWKSSDESIGGFERPGVFVGRSAGTVDVWAEHEGVQSARIPLEVFQTSSLGYCDENLINRAEWSDAFNRVVLESDCAVYEHPDVSSLRFTVTERERPFGIFDPCLDLYVYQGNHLVRTIREEGCGEPFLRPGAPAFDEAAVRYQTLAFWDLKDDRGSPVPPGSYRIVGRFYLYYDPIVSLNVVVQAPNGRIPCQPNACGNGCGYVHACGGTPPIACPEVCTPLCECPQGWGITPEGDCEPCTQECCPKGAACLPETPSCEPPPVCCPSGQVCIPELPPCGGQCCPLGALCGPLDQVPCDCCPVGSPCGENGQRCEPAPWCCPKGALCILPAPECEAECCPPGATCTDDLVPCEMLMCCGPDGTCDPNRPACD